MPRCNCDRPILFAHVLHYCIHNVMQWYAIFQFIAVCFDCLQSNQLSLICRFHIAKSDRQSTLLHRAGRTPEHFLILKAFPKSEKHSGIVFPKTNRIIKEQCGALWCYWTPCSLPFVASVLPSYDHLAATRVGEAKNPGPTQKKEESRSQCLCVILMQYFHIKRNC